eukprot:CAMPEP_0197286022 /NCGR_PEP_ID=MMETSP0890-20130614/1402_1 /TAXON_ID=44058 ORGANISM="Aureoumbra lagunensis, Strain CCMP1510" /NCGR_SAMPLE_ID=MMETSP0890 /ASSEMBLY_ACC=CAM_ASM_000533 /LENGTH=358 /DNA_ID=CAMNT_0042754001 /DNA_START=69 /DNA_END=1145 /DNA_ORIENTATION=+
MIGEKKCQFAVIGCGLKGRGMGWFHALQLFNGECPSAELTDVVEPWFLGGGKDSQGGIAFAQEVVAEMPGVNFHADVENLFQKEGVIKLVLIAGRTSDNPKLFRQAIKAGASHILLEKPGAPTVSELEAMAHDAKEANVPVFMGFIKNIATYVTGALEINKINAGSKVTLISRNGYKREELAECFSRNSEGLLKNMAIHELALAAQFFGMRADNITHVSLDNPENCECLTLDGFTDFSKIDFTLTNSSGTSVRIIADRCAGDGSCAIVTDTTGKELYRRELVDDATKEVVQARLAEHPDWFSYLLTQEPEYKELKQRCAASAVNNKYPDAVATIDIAIHALKLAEYLTPILQSKLTAS